MIAAGLTRTDTDGIAVLSFSLPPDNALTPEMRGALARSLAKALEDPTVVGVVLTGSGRVFSSESGIATALNLGDAPSLSDLCGMVAGAGRPVVAALDGVVDGPGLELALAAQGRVAAPGARLRWSGAALGLLPCGGTTQRLPRRVAPTIALGLLADGRSWSAEAARGAGLVDEVAEDPVAGGRTLARALGQGPAHGPPPLLAAPPDPAALLSEIDRRRAALSGRESPAVPEILRLVEASALLALEAGIEMERAAFADILDRADCAGLRHAARIEAHPRVTGAAPRPVRRIAILGAEGGAALAAQALTHRLAVTLTDPDEALLEARREVIAAALTRDDEAPALDLLALTADLDIPPDADMVIVADDGPVAEEYLRLAGLSARPGTVIAAFGQGEVDPAELTGRRDDTVAVFWPATAGMRRHAALGGAGDGAVATVERLARGFGRYPVRVSGAPERPALALRATLLRCLEGLLLAGAGPGAIDAALGAQGWPGGGPCRALDLSGLDRAAQAADSAAARGWAPAPPGVVRTLAEAGLTGRAAGQGLYQWQDGQPTGPSAALERAIAGAAAEAPRGDEIVARVIAALAVGGMRLVDEGVVPGAAEVDLAGLHALGVPRAWGGPMRAADARGLLWLRGVLRRLDSEDPALWTRPASLDRLIRDARPLAGAD